MDGPAEHLTYSADDIIRFPMGIPGFEGTKEFVIYTRLEHQPFHWMVSTDPQQKLQFVLINPLQIRSDYNPKFPANELKELDVRDPKELLFYAIVTLAEDMRESTANFAGPLFINIRTKVGRQILVEDDRWSVSERILE